LGWSENFDGANCLKQTNKLYNGNYALTDADVQGKNLIKRRFSEKKLKIFFNGISKIFSSAKQVKCPVCVARYCQKIMF